MTPNIIVIDNPNESEVCSEYCADCYIVCMEWGWDDVPRYNGWTLVDQIPDTDTKDIKISLSSVEGYDDDEYYLWAKHPYNRWVNTKTRAWQKFHADYLDAYYLYVPGITKKMCSVKGCGTTRYCALCMNYLLIYIGEELTDFADACEMLDFFLSGFLTPHRFVVDLFHYERFDLLEYLVASKHLDWSTEDCYDIDHIIEYEKEDPNSDPVEEEGEFDHVFHDIIELCKKCKKKKKRSESSCCNIS